MIGLRALGGLDPRSQTDGRTMSKPLQLLDTEMARIHQFFPKSHGGPRVNDLRVLSGMIFINLNGLRLRGATKEYDSLKTHQNRRKR